MIMSNSRGTSSSPPAPSPAPAPGSSSTSTSTFTLSQAFLAYTGDDLEPDISSSNSTCNDDNDEYDDDDEIADIGHQSQTAASFEHLKLKTLQSLYGIQVLKKKKNKIPNKSIKAKTTTNKTDTTSTNTYTYNLSLLRDKSPKGSVDEGIRSLVDLLNAHPCFSTLSSCSGRITLFDPAAGSRGVVSGSGSGSDNDDNNDNDNDDGPNDEEDITSSSQVKSGKGYGTWLLSCHNTITTKQLYDALEQHHHHQQQSQQQQQQQQQREKQQMQPAQSSQPQSSQPQSSQRPAPCLLFQHEPLLLHVAAVNLKRAQQLLKIALELGFRESGIILSCKKITVAIRVHGLSLVVPLVVGSSSSYSSGSMSESCESGESMSESGERSSGKLLYNYEFLNELVNQANHRFVLNQEKLKRLEERIRQVLFRPKNGVVQQEVNGSNTNMEVQECGHDIRQKIVECTWNSSNIPQLCLWGHTAVAIETKMEVQDKGGRKMEMMMDLLVMGGYGTGPLHVKDQTVPCRRSDRVYRLRRYGTSGEWDDGWRECSISNHPNTLSRSDDNGNDDHPLQLQRLQIQTKQQCQLPVIMNIGGFAVAQVSFTAREGAASCVMPENLHCHSMPLIVLFGGRESPSRPKDELLIMSYDANANGVAMFSPCDVRGEIPEARWGHSLTSLSGRDGRIALLVGGRNEKDVLDSVYVLSCKTTTNSRDSSDACSNDYYFVWEKISQSIPRFYHCTSSISSGNYSSNDSEQIVIHGGLSTTALLPRKEHEGDVHYSIMLTLNSDKNEVDCTLNKVQASNNNIGVFGGSMCSITKFGHTLLLRSGGVVSSPSKDVMNTEMESRNELFSRFLLQAMVVDSTHDTSIGNDNVNDNHNCSRPRQSNHRHQLLQTLSIIHKHSSHEERIDATSMVHHCCIALPSQDHHVAEIALIGGGVPLLAFGPSFAKSHHVQIRLSCSDTEHNTIHPPTSATFSKKTNRISSQKTLLRRDNSPPNLKKPSNGRRQRETNVIVVHKSRAKQVKTALEQESLLDRNYRMVKIEHNNDIDSEGMVDDPIANAGAHVAIPITKECVNMISSNHVTHETSSWLDYVVTSGKYVVPFSSSVLGRRK